MRKHIGVVISAAPSKALSTLEHDVSELLGLGMVTLNAKLNGLEDEKLVIRVIETWGFFWDQVLTYIEGVSPSPPLPVHNTETHHQHLSHFYPCRPTRFSNHSIAKRVDRHRRVESLARPRSTPARKSTSAQSHSAHSAIASSSLLRSRSPRFSPRRARIHSRGAPSTSSRASNKCTPVSPHPNLLDVVR